MDDHDATLRRLTALRLPLVLRDPAGPRIELVDRATKPFLEQLWSAG